MAGRPLIDEELRIELAALYASPDRHYHGMSHIDAMLRLMDSHRGALADPEAVEAAIWFHDAVYDSRRSDNEARSAELARERLASRAEPAKLDRIVAMIEATASHNLPTLAGQHALDDAAMFLDMDLAVLGSPPQQFDAYEAAVRREYAWVDEKSWRLGRTSVLQRFLDRPSIFHSALFRTTYEKQARDNIARSLAALSRG